MTTTRRRLVLDYLFASVGLWMVGGFFLDAWAHGHVPVESFFTPYHAVIYSAILGAIAVVGIAYATRPKGASFLGAFPDVYRIPLLGFPLFVLAGFGDLAWHELFGIEVGVDALLSPTHQLLGLAVFVVTSGPIRSAIEQRAQQPRILQQVPALFALATWLELVHFGTAYAFDPGAGRINAPLRVPGFTPQMFTLLSFEYYKIGYGVLVVIFQSFLMAGFALFAISNLLLRPGFLTMLLLLGNGMAAAAFTNDTPLLVTTLAMSAVAGMVGDVLVATLAPSPSRRRAYRMFAVAIPVTYFATYFVVTALSGGIWWDINVAIGATMWAGVAGIGLAFLLPPRVPGA